MFAEESLQVHLAFADAALLQSLEDDGAEPRVSQGERQAPREPFLAGLIGEADLRGSRRASNGDVLGRRFQWRRPIGAGTGDEKGGQDDRSANGW